MTVALVTETVSITASTTVELIVATPRYATILPAALPIELPVAPAITFRVTVPSLKLKLTPVALRTTAAWAGVAIKTIPEMASKTEVTNEVSFLTDERMEILCFKLKAGFPRHTYKDIGRVAIIRK